MPSQMTIHRIMQPAECMLKLFHSTPMLLDLRKFHSSTRKVFGVQHFVHSVNSEFFELISRENLFTATSILRCVRSKYLFRSRFKVGNDASMLV
ncbi:hypothetical protein CDAR_104561 [Caerostris darwini]|uniref:Uncharacterized protein n=1 Tax=Caerostris darwini TaxID=1538125 RepID=A0AAV4PTN7_9ARAC|nr:hypothetical protein CDAR_104561 [Caerostris darwini]